MYKSNAHATLDKENELKRLEDYSYLEKNFIDDSRLDLVRWSVRLFHMSYLAAIFVF